jgi:hypothetical protein
MGKRCSPKWANVHFDTEAEKSWNNSPVFSSHEAELGQNRRVTEVTRRNYLGTISKISPVQLRMWKTRSSGACIQRIDQQIKAYCGPHARLLSAQSLQQLKTALRTSLE